MAKGVLPLDPKTDRAMMLAMTGQGGLISQGGAEFPGSTSGGGPGGKSPPAPPSKEKPRAKTLNRLRKRAVRKTGRPPRGKIKGG